MKRSIFYNILYSSEKKARKNIKRKRPASEFAFEVGQLFCTNSEAIENQWFF